MTAATAGLTRARQRRPSCRPGRSPSPSLSLRLRVRPQVAKWLGAPVLLVLDCWALSRSAAAMVHGYRTFDPHVDVAGVIMNRVAGAAHAEWLRQAMASAPSTADVAVRGARAVTVRGGGCSRRRRRLQPHMAEAATPHGQSTRVRCSAACRRTAESRSRSACSACSHLRG